MLNWLNQNSAGIQIHQPTAIQKTSEYPVTRTMSQNPKKTYEVQRQKHMDPSGSPKQTSGLASTPRGLFIGNKICWDALHAQDREEAFPASQRLHQTLKECRSISRGWDGRRSGALSLPGKQLKIIPFKAIKHRQTRKQLQLQRHVANRSYLGLVSKFWNILHVNSSAGIPTIP